MPSDLTSWQRCLHFSYISYLNHPLCMVHLSSCSKASFTSDLRHSIWTAHLHCSQPNNVRVFSCSHTHINLLSPPLTPHTQHTHTHTHTPHTHTHTTHTHTPHTQHTHTTHSSHTNHSRGGYRGGPTHQASIPTIPNTHPQSLLSMPLPPGSIRGAPLQQIPLVSLPFDSAPQSSWCL